MNPPRLYIHVNIFQLPMISSMRMEGCRGSILFMCCGLLLAVVAAGDGNPLQANKGDCNYLVTIGTTCTKGAETSSNVSLRFGDTMSSDIVVHRLNNKHVRKVDPLQPQVLDDLPRKPFQACMVDQFQVVGRCVKSPICYMYLKLTGPDDWRPGFAQVRTSGFSRLDSYYFYFRRYLPIDVWHGLDVCDREVTPFGIRHKRKVFVEKRSR